MLEQKYPKAVTTLVKDREVLMTFYDFPATHWQHLRTTNPIESTFATIRHRTARAKGLSELAVTGSHALRNALIAPFTAAAQSLEELARMVSEAARSEAAINQEREARFVRERNNQRELLEQARRELAAENARSDRLRTEYDQNERTLADLETTLAERMGNLGELFGVVRQASGDVQAALDDSMVSAQMPERTDFLANLAQRRELPTIPELRQLWSTMVTEIAQSGRVVKFTAPVERTSGEKQELEVVRVGVFNAVSDGTFLDWDTSKSRDNLIELARQPASRFASMARELQAAGPDEVVPFSVDFTRGQILRAVVQSKSPIERVKEDGGIVGYVIIGVGLFGTDLVLALAGVLGGVVGGGAMGSIAVRAPVAAGSDPITRRTSSSRPITGSSLP